MLRWNIKHTGIVFISTNKCSVSLFGNTAAFFIYFLFSHFWERFLHSKKDSRSLDNKWKIDNRCWFQGDNFKWWCIYQTGELISPLKRCAPADENKKVRNKHC